MAGLRRFLAHMTILLAMLTSAEYAQADLLGGSRAVPYGPIFTTVLQDGVHDGEYATKVLSGWPSGLEPSLWERTMRRLGVQKDRGRFVRHLFSNNMMTQYKLVVVNKKCNPYRAKARVANIYSDDNEGKKPPVKGLYILSVSCIGQHVPQDQVME